MTVNPIILLTQQLTCFAGKKVFTEKSDHKLRNWIGFWLLGLSNNYAFGIMLAAAHDLLSPQDPEMEVEFCNPLGTGAMLMADAIPALTGIVVSPFFFKDITARIVITIFLGFVSFILTGLSTSYTMAFAGVICGSFACGFGESSILMYASRFDKEIVSGWSSGTGASTLAASAVYLLLCMFLNTRDTLLIMNIVPCIMAVSYFFILVHPEPEGLEAIVSQNGNEIVIAAPGKHTISISERLGTFRRGLWYAVPIFLSSFFLYFINQGLLELIDFDGTPMDHDMQYRLFLSFSSLGVCISRSSVQMIQIKNLWFCPLLNAFILILLMAHVTSPFIPSIYLVALLTFTTGIFGGATYVNTFYKINNDCQEKDKPVIRAMSLIGNEFACVAAGFMAMPAHDALCHLISGSLLMK